MTPRRRAPPKKTNWAAIVNIVSALTFGVLNLVFAYSLFNSDTVQRIAVLETRVEYLIGEVRELRGHGRGR